MTIADADGKVLSYDNLLPIGSIIGWHKSFVGVPSIPAGFLECNGQVVSDAESPLNGQTLPDLNGSLGAGLKGRFLRGDATSGTLESSQNLAHNHTIGRGSTLGSDGFQANAVIHDSEVGTSSSGGTEARPSNMSVVWIIRIK